MLCGEKKGEVGLDQTFSASEMLEKALISFPEHSSLMGIAC